MENSFEKKIIKNVLTKKDNTIKIKITKKQTKQTKEQKRAMYEGRLLKWNLILCYK